MAQRHTAFLDLLQHIAGEDLGYQAVLTILLHHAVSINADSAAVLTAMLQCVKRMVSIRHHTLAVLAIDAEDAALVLGLVQVFVGVLAFKPELVFHSSLSFSQTDECCAIRFG